MQQFNRTIVVFKMSFDWEQILNGGGQIVDLGIFFIADCTLENDKCCICGLFQAVIVDLAKKFKKQGMLVLRSIIFVITILVFKLFLYKYCNPIE